MGTEAQKVGSDVEPLPGLLCERLPVMSREPRVIPGCNESLFPGATRYQSFLDAVYRNEKDDILALENCHYQSVADPSVPSKPWIRNGLKNATSGSGMLPEHLARVTSPTPQLASRECRSSQIRPTHQQPDEWPILPSVEDPIVTTPLLRAHIDPGADGALRPMVDRASLVDDKRSPSKNFVPSVHLLTNDLDHTAELADFSTSQLYPYAREHNLEEALQPSWPSRQTSPTGTSSALDNHDACPELTPSSTISDEPCDELEEQYSPIDAYCIDTSAPDAASPRMPNTSSFLAAQKLSSALRNSGQSSAQNYQSEIEPVERHVRSPSQDCVATAASHAADTTDMYTALLLREHVESSIHSSENENTGAPAMTSLSRLSDLPLIAAQLGMRLEQLSATLARLQESSVLLLDDLDGENFEGSWDISVSSSRNTTSDVEVVSNEPQDCQDLEAESSGSGSQAMKVSDNGSTQASRLTTLNPKRLHDAGDTDEVEDDGTQKKRPERSRDQWHTGDNSLEDRGVVQIPCFVDGCLGRNDSIAELIRKIATHHGIFLCSRCYTNLDDDSQLQDHKNTGIGCFPFCVSNECSTSARPESVGAASERKHRKAPTCPPPTKVSVVDRWQFLYHSKYPDRPLLSPVLQPGRPHSHCDRQGRQQRRRRAPSTVSDLERQLNAIRVEFASLNEKQKLETQIQELKAQQVISRIANMETIIAGLIESHPIWNPVPNHLMAMIRRDAPGALDTMTPADLPIQSAMQAPALATPNLVGRGQLPVPSNLYGIEPWDQQIFNKGLEPVTLDPMDDTDDRVLVTPQEYSFFDAPQQMP